VYFYLLRWQVIYINTKKQEIFYFFFIFVVLNHNKHDGAFLCHTVDFTFGDSNNTKF